MGIRRRNYGKNHAYYIDDVKAMGVTTAIKGGLPSPALMYWSARTVAEYVADTPPSDLDVLRGLGRQGMVNALKEVPWKKRDAAANRGTEIHNLAEKLVAGHPVEVPEEIAGHVESVVKFLDDWNIQPLVVEGVCASRKWMYAGTFDLVAETPHKGTILFDYKTGASGIWPETALQLAAYRHAEVFLDVNGAEVPMADLGITSAKAVWVRADGYDVIPVDTSDTVYKHFLHILYTARGNDKDAFKQWVGTPEGPSA